MIELQAELRASKLEADQKNLGLGFRVQGFGFRVQGLGFRVQGLGLGVKGLESGL